MRRFAKIMHNLCVPVTVTVTVTLPVNVDNVRVPHCLRYANICARQYTHVCGGHLANSLFTVFGPVGGLY